MFRRKCRKTVARARSFPAARHDATNLTKVLRERAAPTGKVLLDGEQPVGCALLCSKSLRQRLAASKSEAFEGIPNVSRSACIAAGVPSAIKMRSMKCPHRIFRRDYLVVRERARSADNRIVGQPLKPFAIVRAIAVVRAFSIFGRGREG
jgi:hypothetical protein